MMKNQIKNHKPVSQRTNHSIGNMAIAFVLANLLLPHAFGQITVLQPAPTSVNPVMGFETTKGWTVKSNSPATTTTAVALRTQGSFAVAVVNAANPTTLTSGAVPSTATALAGIASSDAILEVDVLPPPGASGTLQLTVTSPSKGLKGELVGEVALQSSSSRIFSTLKFPVPAKVREALTGAFNDLVFQFVLNSPPGSAGAEFLFDNLRVVSVPLVEAKLGVKPPESFGGSVDLTATGQTPATQTFPITAIQVPDRLLLVQGAAGSTTAKLTLGHDNLQTFQCTYSADPNDAKNHTYLVTSCNDGVTAGDIVAVNTAQLTIVGGAPLMAIEAQLAKNPIGDTVGSGLIPPMPTFWGHSNGCNPAPVAGKVVTATADCQAQVAEANQIVTDYFNQVNNSQTPHNWIVTPAGNVALRNGTGLPLDADIVKAPTGPLPQPIQTGVSQDFPFDKEGHVNKGGSFDAYWRLNGDLNVQGDNKGNATAHFDATFSGHAVLLGNDVDVVSANATVDAASGSAPKSTGSIQLYLFGEQIPGGGSVDASTDLNYNVSESRDFNVATIPVWIFTIEVDATASASLTTTGKLAVTGFTLAVDPKVSLGTHIFGGIDLGIASGGVDVKIDLLEAEAPVNVQAGLGFDLSPTDCALTINFSASADVTVSAAGGEVDLVASFGICPFCDSESYTLLKWNPLVSVTKNLFTEGPITFPAVSLPGSMCAAPLNELAISSPPANSTTNIVYPLVALAIDSTLKPVACQNQTWTITPAEPITSANGCPVSVQFTHTGAHTVTLTAVQNFTTSSGKAVTESGTTSETVNVTAPAAGAYIVGLNPAPAAILPPYNNQTVVLIIPTYPSPLQLTGQIQGLPTAATMSWTATDSKGNTVVISKAAIPSGGQQNVNWTVTAPDHYIIRMVVADATGKQLAAATTTIEVDQVAVIF